MIRLCLLLFFYCSASFSAVEIIFWHSMAGHLGTNVQQLVNAYNQSQEKYRIIPVYKGEYTETLTSFAAAFIAKKTPALIQISEVGTAVMLSSPGIIKPLTTLINEQKQVLPLASFLPALKETYSRNGELQAMPFNTSVPVMFYNKEALKRVQGDDHFPQTWQELEHTAAQLKKLGYACVYTSAYPAWIHIESFMTIHGLPLFSSSSLQFIYNHPGLQRHLQRLKRWQKNAYFKYGGRANDATALFTSGHCLILSQSSGSFQSLAKLVPFTLGVAPMPLDITITKKRYHNVVGGAALWAVAGQSPEIYRGIADFYHYLANPLVQQRWHKRTGYLPLGIKGAYHSLESEALLPTLSIAKFDLQMTLANPGMNNASLPMNQVRVINDEALETIFAGIMSPQEALTSSVKRANFALQRFMHNNGMFH